MMRIAFFTLLSPVQSALADFGEGLVWALSQVPGVAVDLFINDDYQPDNAAIVERFKIYTFYEFGSRARDYDVVLYSMGDHSIYNGYMLEFIHRYPGVVILNDLTLHRCIMHSTLGRGDTWAYLDELRYAYGIQDLRIAQRMEAGLGDHLVMEYPLFERIVDSSLSIVVQNRFARDRILVARPEARVKCIPYPFFMPPGFPDLCLADGRARQRGEMGLEDHFVVGSFGIFVPNKHLEDCLDAFANVVRKHSRSKYILGGYAIEGYDLAGRIRELGLQEHVVITGWMPPPQFARYMFALDVGIHLRYPHIGGTPFTPIRLMGLDVCTIVSDIEPLAELPQGACVKIAPDEYQGETLAAVLAYLADHPEFMRQIGGNGREFVARYHNVEDIARRYVDWIETLY